MDFSVLEAYLTKNLISTNTFKKCEAMSSTLFHLSVSESGKLIYLKNITDRRSDWTLLNVTFLRAWTRRKCIGKCLTANVLSKQFWTLEMILAWCTSPQKSCHDLKEIDTIPDASFVSSVLVRSTFVKRSLVWILVYKFKWNGRKRTSMQSRHKILI